MSEIRASQGAGQARALLLALALALLGMPAALGVLRGEPDLARALAWLALAAPAAGALACAYALSAFGFGLAIPGAWLLLLVLVDARASGDLPGPLWAALALLGSFWVGWALACLVRGTPARAGAIVLCLSALLAGLPALGGLARAPWSPRLAALLLDLSPVVLVEECAGVDWMRHAAVYEPVGTHTIGPELRLPYRGRLAGPATLLVGCVLASVARRLRARSGLDREER